VRPRMSLVLQSLLPYPHSCQGTSPHQQGWDTKMAMLSFCGVDVSKDRLDVVVLPEGWFFSVSNDPAAVFFRPSCRGNFSPYFRRELSLHRGTTLRVRS